MKKLMIGLVLVCVACTAPEESRRTLESSGYTDIVTGDFNMFACGKDDAFSTEFTAKNSQGKQVHGVVCCGMLKSCTVRF